jgi:hypothetical protein
VSSAILRSSTAVFAEEVQGEVKYSDPFPLNRGTIYEYGDDIPDICFFPAGKARWDGSKIMTAEWRQLTGFQRMRFISEYAGELEKQYGHPVDLKGGWEYLRLMNAYAVKACENGCQPEDRMTAALEALLAAKASQGYKSSGKDPEISDKAEAEKKKVGYKFGLEDVTGQGTVRASNLKMGVDYKVSERSSVGVEASQGLHDTNDAAAWGKSVDDETAAKARYKVSF